MLSLRHLQHHLHLPFLRVSPTALLRHFIKGHATLKLLQKHNEQHTSDGVALGPIQCYSICVSVSSCWLDGAGLILRQYSLARRDDGTVLIHFTVDWSYSPHVNNRTLHYRLDGAVNLDSCKLPHLDKLTKEGCMGLLAVRSSTATGAKCLCLQNLRYSCACKANISIGKHSHGCKMPSAVLHTGGRFLVSEIQHVSGQEAA